MKMTACRTCLRRISRITRRAMVWDSRVSRQLAPRCLLRQNRSLREPVSKKMGKSVLPVLRHLYFTFCLSFSLSFPPPLFPPLGLPKRGRRIKLLRHAITRLYLLRSAKFCYQASVGTMMELGTWFGELFELGQLHIARKSPWRVPYEQKMIQARFTFSHGRSNWEKGMYLQRVTRAHTKRDYIGPMAASQCRYLGLHADSTNRCFRAIIVQRILYSFLSIYLDRAEQGVATYIPWAVRLGTIEQLYLASRQAGK